ncbi:MAG: hypothetical protein DMF75_14790, partial [Acidobacteria bacterium]
GATGWETQLEANKVAYFDEFVTRSTFATVYPTTMTYAQYVDALNANTGGALSTSKRDELVTSLTNGMTRAQALRSVVEDNNFSSAQFNKAFVLMQYFGYLRRNPNDSPDQNFDGYNFWLTKLNQFNGNFVNAEMVKAFITSAEYRQRFGPRSINQAMAHCKTSLRGRSFYAKDLHAGQGNYVWIRDPRAPRFARV